MPVTLLEQAKVEAKRAEKATVLINKVNNSREHDV
jgi:hypothetical protein